MRLLTNIKLCGNRSLTDIQKTTTSESDYIGVIFAPSKRKIKPEALRAWLKTCPIQKDQQLVGVFVNPTIQELEEVLYFFDLDIIQLHGEETVSEVLKVKELFGLPIWKVIHHDEQGMEKMELFQGVVDGFVIDTKVKGVWGGSGKRFDWAVAPSYIQQAKKYGVPCFIAGGVTPDNIQELLTYQPDGIDISSGIETDEEKDLEKIDEVIRRTKTHVSHIS